MLVNIFVMSPVQISPVTVATADHTLTDNRYFIGKYRANYMEEK